MATAEKQAPIFLLTGNTPNGRKVAICLEELKAAYPNSGIDYEIRKIDFSTNEQKSDWYIKVRCLLDWSDRSSTHPPKS